MLPATLDNDVGLRNAYAKACIELGLGPDEASRSRRDQLTMLSCAMSDPQELDEINRRIAILRDNLRNLVEQAAAY